jgi:hypothetical protein
MIRIALTAAYHTRHPLDARIRCRKLHPDPEPYPAYPG